MDRRGFFKTMLITPLLTPFLLASKTTESDSELYLITDDPQKFLPFILNELKNFGVSFGQKLALLKSCPFENELKKTLAHNGFKYVQNPIQADITLSFSHLQNKALSSFTFVKGGRIWDIRSRNLHSLWMEINKNNSPSSLLTTASFKNTQKAIPHGEFVSIYKDGRKIERISLKENTSRRFNTRGGEIVVKVKDRKAWVSESPCAQKICQYSPPVYLAGERIICAPSHFLLEIQGPRSIDTIIG